MTSHRTTVVTGTASGIGLATAAHLEEQGHRVLRVDIRDADVTVDLGTGCGRAQLVDEISRLSGGTVDGVIACAGVLTPADTAVSVNYFGAIATLDGLRSLLAAAESPRAAVVSSMGSVSAQLNPEADAELTALLDLGDEAGARARARVAAGEGAPEPWLYGVGKLALNRWVRRTAPSDDWAGKGISLNAVAPGVVRTPLMSEAFATEEGVAALHRGSPAPLNGFLEPVVIARALGWLVSSENSHMCGQVVFVDGGAEAIRRPGLW